MNEESPLTPRQQGRAKVVRRAGLLLMVVLIAWTIGATVAGVVRGLKNDTVREPAPVQQLHPGDRHAR